MVVFKSRGTPKSSILIGFSIINHPFWGPTIFWKHPYRYLYCESDCFLRGEVGLACCQVNLNNKKNILPSDSRRYYLVGGWANPFEKYARQNGFIFPKVRGENKKMSCHHPELPFLRRSSPWFSTVSTWKICNRRQIGSSFPQGLGWKFPDVWNHHRSAKT